MSILLPSVMYGCVSATLVRSVAQGLLKIESAELEDICLLLGASMTESKPVWEGLISDGWIVKDSVNGKWLPSEEVRSLASARIGNPLTRKKADELIAKALANANKLNSEPTETSEYGTYWITKIAVFGSYLQDSEELGDLDIAWEVSERSNMKNWFINCLMNSIDPLSRTRGKFRPKGPYTKIINFDHMLSLGCQYKTIYEFKVPEIVG